MREGSRFGIVRALVGAVAAGSLLLAAFFCAFPWSMTRRAGAEQKPERLQPMTLVFEPDSAEVRKEIDAGNAKFIRAWRTGDADLFASCFAEDGALLHPGRPAVVGREKIRERMRDLFSRLRMTSGEIATVDVYILGDTAYETGKWKFAIGPVGKPATEPDSGRFVEVWRREAGGAWRMWRDIGVPGD